MVSMSFFVQWHSDLAQYRVINTVGEKTHDLFFCTVVSCYKQVCPPLKHHGERVGGEGEGGREEDILILYGVKC